MATQDNQQGKVGNDQIARAIAIGLISTGVEGGYDAVSCSTAGDYPSMGVSQWEGIDGRGDALLASIPGCERFIGRSYSSLSDSDIADLKQLLDSEKGQKAQQDILSQDCLEKYLPALAGVENLNNPKSYIYAGIWCPTSHSVVTTFLKNRQNAFDINNLETIRDMFREQYYIAAGVGSEYAEGYANRAIITYNYVASLDESISNASIDKSIANSVAAGKKGTGVASDDGFSIKPKRHGKHTDSKITKLPKGKTFCEPVYPDLVTVSDKVPKWLLDKANIPLNKMTPDSLVMYSIPDKVLRDACGVDLDVILGNAAAFKERQRVFDPSKYKEEFKQSNPGKPTNNNDPFPVDLKIEELETHKPTVKIHTITTCPEAINATKAVLNVSDRAEKRIVKLENMMATMLRYLFRMANRVQINCVYYGGQSA